VVTAGITLALLGIVPNVFAAVGFHSAWAPIALVVVLGIVFGSALGALLIPAFTILQERTDADSRGRIFGGIFTVINAAVAIPLLVAGGLSDLFGVDRVVAALGVLLVLLGIGVRTVGWRHLAVLESDETQVSLSAVEG
jgi:MFS family permease